MGSFYANVTLLDVVDDDAVRRAIGDGPAFFGRSGERDTLVFPDDDRWPDAGKALSSALDARVVGVSVHDDDILTVAAWTGGVLVYELSVPDPGEYFGMSLEEMGIDEADIAGFWGGEAPGHDTATLVAALGRGDATLFDRALAADFVFASERHQAVAEALGLPTAAVGWGYGYLQTDGTEFGAGPLNHIPS